MDIINIIDTNTNRKYKLPFRAGSDCRSVIELKEELRTLLEREEEQQCITNISLSFSGTELRNYMLVSSYSIQSNDILYMTVERKPIEHRGREFLVAALRPSGTMPTGPGLGLF